MATRDEILAKYKTPAVDTSSMGVLSPVQDLGTYNKIPEDLARRLAPKEVPIPTPSFAKDAIPVTQPAPTKTTTPTTSKVNTYDVLKDATGLFVNVVRSIPEIRNQGTAAQTGLLQTFSGLETSLGQLATQVGSREAVYMKSSTVLRDKVGEVLRNVGKKLEEAGENDYKLAEVLGQTLPKFSFDPNSGEQHKAIAAGIVQNAPNLLGGVLVGAATLPAGPIASTLATLSYSAALEGGFSYREAKALGGTDEQARRIMVQVGLVNGILETLPISRFLNRTQATRAVKTQILKNVAGNIAKQAVEEGTTEGLQEITLNAAMQEVDKNRSLFQGVPESAFFGAILGGGLAAGGEVITAADKETGGKLRLGMSIEDVSGGKPSVPQVDEKAIEKTKQDVENAFGQVNQMLEMSIDTTRGGAIVPSEDGYKRLKGTYPSFMPEDMRSKADMKLASELLNGKEVKTEKQKRLYESMLSFVSEQVGPERFNDYEYTQFLQKMQDDATAERKVFIDKFVADLKKQRRSMTPAETKAAIKQSTEVEKAPFIQKRESTLLKDRITTLARGYREGAKLTRDQVAATQTEIIDLISESKMVPEDRAGFIKTIRNIQTDEQLQKALPELQERIDRVVADTQKRQYRNQIIKTVKRATESPSVSIEYKAKIQEIVSAYELKGHNKDTIDKLQKAKAHFEQQAQNGEDVEIPYRLLQNIEILNRTPFKDIPAPTLEAVLNDIALLEKLGRTKFRTRKEVYEYEKQHVMTELKEGTKPLNKGELVVPKAGERLTRSQKLRNYMQKAMNEASRIDMVLSPIDVITDVLDGSKGTYDGANHRNIKQRFDRDYNAYLNDKYGTQDPVIDLANEYKLDETNFTRMGLVAAREQDGGVEKLKNNGYTQKEIDAVTLSKQEQEVLDLMRSQMNKNFPTIQRVQREVYNQEVRQVNNYFSFMTDWSAMDEAEVYLRMGPEVVEYGKSMADVGERVKSNINPAFVKKREGAGRQKIEINAMTVFMKHTDNTAYFLNFAKDSKMLGEIVRTPEYREVAGDAGQLLMLEYIDVVARQGGAAGANQIAILDMLRKNISAGILGLKLSTVAIQWTALVDGMGMIGPSAVVTGTNNFIMNKELRDMVLSFPELRERVGGETAIAELKDGGWLTELQSKGFIPMKFVDKVVASSVALGAYMQKMDALGLPVDPNNINQEAVEYAQLVTRRTQASSSFKDVPLAISRGSLTGNKSFDRVLFQFQNFVLFRFSRIRHDAIRVGIAQKDPKHAANVMFWIMLSSLAATGTRIGVRAVTDAITGEEPPEEDPDKMPYAQKSYLMELLGTVPFMGNIMGSYFYDSAFMPIIDVPQNVLEGAKKMFEGSKPETKAKGFIEFSTSVGAILGIPGSIQAQQLLKKAVPESESNDVMSKYKKKSASGDVMDKYKNKSDGGSVMDKYK
jgi:hypothetical protein